MTDNDFIDGLVQDAGPVTPLFSPFIRFILWLGVSIATSFIGIFYFSLRFNLHAQLHSFHFWGETGLVLLSLIMAGGASLWLSQSEYRHIKRVWLALIPSAVWLAHLIIRLYLETRHVSHFPHLDAGSACSYRVSILGLIPTFSLFFLVKRATPVKLALIGTALFIAGLSVGAFSLQFICPAESALHTLVWHFGPVLLFAIVGLLLSKKLLDW